MAYTMKLGPKQLDRQKETKISLHERLYNLANVYSRTCDSDRIAELSPVNIVICDNEIDRSHYSVLLQSHLLLKSGIPMISLGHP